MSQRLAEIGVDVHHRHTVGDNLGRIVSVLELALSRSDVVLICGGLGPTQDDLTRESTAAVTGRPLRSDAEAEQHLRGFFARRGLTPTPNNLKQATLIPSAIALPNRAGTAPGWWVEKENRIIVLLPGPPVELQDMWFREVLPRLQSRSGAVILSRTLKTWGVCEGMVDEFVAPFLGSANPTLGIYAKGDGIHLRITAKAANEDEALSLIHISEPTRPY